MSSIERATDKLDQLKSKSTFEKMVGVAAVLTDLLEAHQIKPVIVGGLGSSKGHLVE
ncbi:hypothetical protein [Lentibacillus sediminis]|uniref:hypothetical protein n=1 Tax=Lentibacillus sediminis TaxID=1940529 RepID=UPI0013043C9B|nr:hypothetical protein [Lentibacillus sediminis]